jgi:hypothetical protein
MSAESAPQHHRYSWRRVTGYRRAQLRGAVSEKVFADFFHGVYDYTVNYQLAKDYVERLKAPLKGFYTFQRSAHSPIFEEPQKARPKPPPPANMPTAVTATVPMRCGQRPIWPSRHTWPGSPPGSGSRPARLAPATGRCCWPMGRA